MNKIEMGNSKLFKKIEIEFLQPKEQNLVPNGDCGQIYCVESRIGATLVPNCQSWLLSKVNTTPNLWYLYGKLAPCEHDNPTPTKQTGLARGESF